MSTSISFNQEQAARLAEIFDCALETLEPVEFMEKLEALVAGDAVRFTDAERGAFNEIMGVDLDTALPDAAGLIAGLIEMIEQRLKAVAPGGKALSRNPLVADAQTLALAADPAHLPDLPDESEEWTPEQHERLLRILDYKGHDPGVDTLLDRISELVKERSKQLARFCGKDSDEAEVMALSAMTQRGEDALVRDARRQAAAGLNSS